MYKRIFGFLEKTYKFNATKYLYTNAYIKTCIRVHNTMCTLYTICILKTIRSVFHTRVSFFVKGCFKNFPKLDKTYFYVREKWRKCLFTTLSFWKILSLTNLALPMWTNTFSSSLFAILIKFIEGFLVINLHMEHINRIRKKKIFVEPR